ncbi:MAG: DNA translocase FtsK 4TM domain-containing protein, partial [Anaerolineae bacterium]|nr:DNA translocase FtsK 4TM domain-containing protein [Anaerolineae bacterium]
MSAQRKKRKKSKSLPSTLNNISGWVASKAGLITGSSRAKPKARRSSSKALPSPIRSGLTLDRKLDLIGVVLALVGLLTFLGLLSGGRGSLTSFWISFLSKSFGWAVYIFPLALMAIGLWLVLRNFERAPKLAVERFFGLALLYLDFLAVLHLLAFPASAEASYAVAAAGRGGGYLGAAITVLLGNGLGPWGLAITLVGLTLIALALTLDVSVLDLFGWVRPVLLRLGDWWDERQAAPYSQPQPPLPHSAPAVPAPQVSPEEPALVELPQQQPDVPSVTLGKPRPTPATAQAPARPWELPVITDMLDIGVAVTLNEGLDSQRAKLIEDTLASFGAPVNVVEINRG